MAIWALSIVFATVFIAGGLVALRNLENAAQRRNSTSRVNMSRGTKSAAPLEIQPQTGDLRALDEGCIEGEACHVG